MSTSNKRSRQLGVTLVEMMVAVAILAILSTIAVPAYQGMIASSRVTAATNDMLATLSHARSEAIRRAATITVSANGGDWMTGWSSTTADGTTLSSGGITSTGVIVDNAITSIAFAPDGQTSDTGTLAITSSYSTKTRSLRILGSGKVVLID